MEYFLWNGGKIHIKGLARQLKLSPNTAQIYLQLYEKEGLLTKEKVGNVILYGLSGNIVVAEFKKTYILLRLNKHIKAFLNDNKLISSLILYGSSAKGEYDKNSDIDLLVISQSKSIELKSIHSIEAELGREVKIEVLSLGEWRKLADKGDAFYLSVIKNSIALYGVIP